MKTEVTMKRELFGREIKQKSQSEFFSATDLVRAGNLWRVSNGMPIFDMKAWFHNQGTKDFIDALEKEYGVVKISGRGRGVNTWIHPFLFIDMALAISPELKIQVYSWLYDHLLKYRNNSGDSYKKMVGAIYSKYSVKSQFPRYIQEYASRIRNEIGVKDWNEATEEQLNRRDKIHEAVSTLSHVMTDPDKILEIAFKIVD
jgi:hypothetical protein